MPVTAEIRRLNRALDQRPAAVASLGGKYGAVPTVNRLRNDLDPLEWDVHNVSHGPAGYHGGAR